MALSNLEKARNKAAARVRNRAHSARLGQYRKAREAVERMAEVVEARKAADAANAALEQALEERNRREAEIDGKIAELQLEKAALRNSPELEKLSEDRKKKSQSWYWLKSQKEEAVDEGFPDLRGAAGSSAAAWNPPSEVLEEMERARQAATVDEGAAEKDS